MSSAKIPPKIPARPGKDTVYVDVDDEITAIIDKVEAAKEKVVALVLPKRSMVLQSVVNMRLLKRNAEKAGKSVVLISAEEALLPLAGAVGLHVAKNLQSKPEVPSAPEGVTAAIEATTDLPENIGDEIEEPSTKLDYHRTIGELAAKHSEEDESEAIDLGDDEADAQTDAPKAPKTKTPKDKKLKIPNFDRFRIMVFGGIALLIALIVFIFLAISVLPKATITINTESIPISTNLTLKASDTAKAVDEPSNTIPAVLKTLDQTSNQQVPATGVQNNGQKASGTVTLLNCGNDPVVVPAGAGVSTGGLTYITQKSTSIASGNFDGGGHCKTTGPQASTGSVDVVAQQGGAKYNVSSGQSFGISGQGSTLTGSNGSAFSGGTDNNVTVVSQADLDKAKGKISSTDTDNFTKAFEKQLTDAGFYLLTSTLKQADPVITATPALGQPATTVTASVKVTFSMVVIQKSDLLKIITDSLDKKIDPKKQKINGDILKGASVAVQDQPSPSTATLNVSEDTTATPTIDVATVKKQATGQKVGDIKSAIGGLPGVKSVDVKMSPFWVSKAPKVSKITVKLLQVSTSAKSGG